jgi:hypothetical protein
MLMVTVINHGSCRNTHTPQTPLPQTLTKDYPKKVKFYRFKLTPRKREQGPDRSTSQEADKAVHEDSGPLINGQALSEVTRTQEQIDDSLERSLARTRREMLDLAECNDWDMFVTLTFDPKKHPRCNEIPYALNKVDNWLMNQKRKYGHFDHLGVYEPQKSGNIHFHMLLNGFTGHYHEVPLSKRQKNRKQEGLHAYKIDSWERNNGFADMETIVDKDRLAKYMMKYLQKDLSSSIHGKGSKRYFASKGLTRPKKTYWLELSEMIATGNYTEHQLEHYENDYVEITTLYKKD